MKSEFEFINQLKTRFGLSKIGDDAAVLPKDDKTDLVISADMLVEDIDFRMEWTTPEFIGQKALAVSISDIVAMGAKPKYSLVSIGIPERIWKSDFVDEFYKGYLGSGTKRHIELIGGDVSKTPDKVVIDSIILGEVEKGKAVLRSTAQVGDLIFVTGELGGASAGLKLLENGIRPDSDVNPGWQSKLILKQLTPIPFYDSTEFTEFATSMIDLSDGLSSDLMHICKTSKVGAKIFADKIPIYRKLVDLSEQNYKNLLSKNLDKLDFALHGGEDFKLLFTISPSVFEKKSEKFSERFHQIGEITQDVGKIELIRDEKSEILEPKGFQHF
jgi:thiamine-monophosphate kinase